MPHISDFELQEYLDTMLNADAARTVAAHISSCNECTKRATSFSLLNHSIRQVPLERASTQFTDQVSKKIGMREMPSFAWSLLTNLAPFILVTIVIVIIAGALGLSGALNSPEMSSSVQATQKVYDTVTSGIATGIKTANEWTKKLFPYKISNEGIAWVVFLICFLSAIALLDKFIFVKAWKKRKGSNDTFSNIITL